jgi:hypothetical protein
MAQIMRRALALMISLRTGVKLDVGFFQHFLNALNVTPEGPAWPAPNSQ